MLAGKKKATFKLRRTRRKASAEAVFVSPCIPRYIPNY